MTADFNDYESEGELQAEAFIYELSALLERWGVGFWATELYQIQFVHQRESLSVGANVCKQTLVNTLAEIERDRALGEEVLQDE